MPDVDVVLRPAARLFYDRVATPSERLRIDEALSTICATPVVDEAVRFSTTHGDTLYNDGDVWLLYRSVNNWTVEVIGIGTVE